MSRSGRRRATPTVALLLVGVIAVGACSDGPDVAGGGLPGAGGPGGAPAGAEPAEDLVGTIWELDAVIDGAVRRAAVAPATLEFSAGGRLGGTTGCNTFGGTYAQRGRALRLVPGAITRRGCEDAALADQEAALLAALPRVRSADRSGGRLVLAAAGGAPLLVYGPGSTDLVGSSWQVTGVNNGRDAVVSSALVEVLSMAFAADGRVVGTDGCNRFEADYRTSGDALEIGPLTSTEVACDADVTAVAEEFRAALGRAATFAIRGKDLTLRDGAGAIQVTARSTG